MRNLSSYHDPRIKPGPGCQIDTTDPLAKGLVGYWPMNEGGGNVVLNCANPSAGKGTLTGNGIYWQSGPQGPRLYCSGTDDYVSIANNGIFQLPGELTFVLAWQTSSSTPDYRNSIYDATTQTGWQLMQDDSPNKYRWIIYGGGGASQIVDSDVVPTENAVVLVGTRDAANVMRLYVNGNMQSGSKTQSGGITTTSSLILGASWNIQNDLVGWLDYAMVYSRALSPSEIQQLYVDPYRLLRRPQIVLWGAGSDEGGGGTEHNLGGAVTAQSAASGDMSSSKPMTGTIASQATTSSNASVSKALAGASTASTFLTGALTLVKSVAGTVTVQSQASTASIAGSLVVAKPLTGTATAAGSPSGSLGSTKTVAGSLAAVPDAAGEVTVVRALTGQVQAQASVSGEIATEGSVALSGSISVVAGAHGSVVRAVAMTGEIDCVASFGAAGSVARLLSGSIDGASSMSGALYIPGAVNLVAAFLLMKKTR
ncbi:MAG TPA: LamG-like jellyroll fold domain-containing protein [Phycisphaerae bacterium]|nr:LamG-like jellyroll fold domain-containing protein [Phycisphaerae bacterium]